MTIPQPISLIGCRHDVLGHALKAVGVLRALSTCAAEDDCDRDAEGWWDPEGASFMIRSSRYPDAASLAKFFAEKYRPTPIIAAWNKSGGVTDKIEVTISCRSGDVTQFRSDNKVILEASGLKQNKKLSKAGALVFTLSDETHLHDLQELAAAAGLVCSRKEKRTRGKVKTEITIASGIGPLERFREEQSDALATLGFGTNKGLSASGQLKFSTDSANRPRVDVLVAKFNDTFAASSTLTDRPLLASVVAKESGTDGTLPKIERMLGSDAVVRDCLALAQDWVGRLQERGMSSAYAAKTFASYRDHLPASVAAAFDAISVSHLIGRNDNPVFVNRGQQGRTDVFRMNWEHFIKFKDSPLVFVRASLFAERTARGETHGGTTKGKGAPFFPDAIKSYNQGVEWVSEELPFCPLDYLLAVEGAFAMRGAVSKSLGTKSQSYAAFPFLFEGTETLCDDQGDVTGLGTSLWFPIWTRPATYAELHSFILDSQARLPRKECHFSSDFIRAIRSQGVDAGFEAFHEFRFKMKGARIPWAVSARLVQCTGAALPGVLSELLAPIDAAGFLGQFRFRTPNEVKRDRKPDLHPLRAPALQTIEAAAAEPDAQRIVAVLSSLATLNAQLACSKSLRENIGGGRVAFVPALHCDNWSVTLQDLESSPEFEIARALASIRGQEKQPDGSYSEVEPFQGSLVPLHRSHDAWYLPDPPSPQAVWSGIDLARDLSFVLTRRVLDSAKDIRPAVVGTCSARLRTILAFLQGKLDDRRIARLVEALSLIDWRYSAGRTEEDCDQPWDEEELDPVPIAYAAMRSLLEVACDVQRTESEKLAAPSEPRARVQRAVSLLSRQEPRMAAAATVEALRRLAIIGVTNPYGNESQREKPTLAGRDVVQVSESLVVDVELARRLAAAVLIPLDWRDRWTLFRAITLPQTAS